MNIFDFLQKHRDLLPFSNYWHFTDSQILVSNGTFNYLEINSSCLNLFGIDILPKLKSEDTSNWNKFDLHFDFINKIKNNITKLDHIGFGYQIVNLDSEMAFFKKNLPQDFELVEENSGDPKNNRWFFIKHKIDRSVTKVELVWYFSQKYQDYFPQFQLDIDTNLPFASILEITDNLFGKNFFFWKYDVPNYGVVMAMGKLGQIDGVKILLGVGTNLRKQQTFKTT